MSKFFIAGSVTITTVSLMIEEIIFGIALVLSILVIWARALMEP